MSKQAVSRITMNLPTALLAHLDAMAEAEFTNRTAVISRLLQAGIRDWRNPLTGAPQVPRTATPTPSTAQAQTRGRRAKPAGPVVMPDGSLSPAMEAMLAEQEALAAEEDTTP